MKQLLLITTISCVCASSLFAGSSCNTCPTAPAQNSKEKTTDADDAKKDAEKDTIKDLLAANESTPSMAPPADDKNAAPTDSDPSDTQIQTKFLLANGTAPSTTDANKPAAPADEKKTETEADKAAQPQLIA